MHSAHNLFSELSIILKIHCHFILVVQERKANCALYHVHRCSTSLVLLFSVLCELLRMRLVQKRQTSDRVHGVSSENIGATSNKYSCMICIMMLSPLTSINRQTVQDKLLDDGSRSNWCQSIYKSIMCSVSTKGGGLSRMWLCCIRMQTLHFDPRRILTVRISETASECCGKWIFVRLRGVGEATACSHHRKLDAST